LIEMHIGFLTPEYVTPRGLDGGLANYLRKVGLALTARGHHVSVLVLSDHNGCWQDEGVRVYEVGRFKVPIRFKRNRRLVPWVSAFEQIQSSRRLAKMAWKIHQRTPFDIFQASSYKAPGYALRHNERVPLVCRVSSYTPLCRSAFGRPRNFSECLSDWLEVRQVLDADATFAPSEFIAETFARIEGFRPQLVRTPLDVLPQEALDASFHNKHLMNMSYLLFFGTLSRIKGVDLLAGIIPSVLERHKNIAFVFIGRDDGLPHGQKMFDYIRSECQGYEERLHYHPPLPKAELFPVIANAVGVLMPSRVDNYPNACLEAQSLGIPVIGTYDSSLDEMIVDGETGFLAQNGSPSSLEGAIASLLDQTPNQRLHMQENIHAHINKITSEDRLAQLVHFYETTITHFHSGSR